MSSNNNRVEQVIDQGQPRILLKGCIVNPWSPSDALFNIELNVTDLFKPEEYMAWKEELEDRLNALDAKYTRREKSLRGRRVEATYKTVLRGGQKTRMRVLKIQPYPSRFASWLGFIRTKFYGSANYTGILQDYSRILSEERHGKHIVQTRLVPEGLLGELSRAVDELNKEIDKLQEEVNGYESSQDFVTLQEVILRMVPPERWSKHPGSVHARLHGIYLNPIPIVASRDFIESFTSEEAQQQIKESLTRIVAQTVHAAQRDLENLVDTLSRALTEKITTAEMEKALAHAKKMAMETDVYRFIKPSFEAVQTVVQAINTGDAEFVKQATSYAARHFGIDEVIGKPNETLRAIRDHLHGEIDPRIKGLISQALS